MSFRSRMLLFQVFLFAFTLKAQRYGFSLEIGQHYGIQTRNQQDAPFPSTRSYSLGSGVVRQVMLQVYPDSSNWFFSAGFQHFAGNGTVTARNNDLLFERAQYTELRSIRLLSRLSYRFDIGASAVTLNAGILIPLANRMEEETWIYDSTGFARTEARTGNYFTAGFSGGVGFQTKLTPVIRLFCNADFVLMNAGVKSRVITGYSDSKGRSMEEEYPYMADRSTLYWKDQTAIRNNRDVLPAAFDKDKSTDKLSYTRSYSSIGLQAGLIFLF